MSAAPTGNGGRGSDMTPRKSCVLHAGFHKTGTTAIQRAMQSYDDGRTAYADLGTHNHSIPLGMAFPQSEIMDDAAHDLVAESRAKLEEALRHDCDRIILSAENIGAMQEDTLRALRDLITHHCDPIDVIIFVREPLSWTASLVQQALKVGRPCDLHPFRGHMRTRLERLDRVFGKGHVHIHRYEDKAAHGGDIVALFAHMLNLDPAGMRRVDRRMNVSMPIMTVRALYQLRQVPAHADVLQHVPKARHAFRTAIARLEGDRVAMDPAHFADAVDLEDYAYLNTRIDTPYDLQLPPDASVEEYMRFEDPHLLQAFNDSLLEQRVLAESTKDYAFALSLFFMHAIGRVSARKE